MSRGEDASSERLKVFTLIIAGVLLILAGLLWKNVRTLDRAREQSAGGQRLKSSQHMSLAPAEAEHSEPLGEALLQLSCEQLSLYNRQKEILDKKGSLDFFHPVMQASGHGEVFCGDRQSGRLFLVNPQGILWETLLDGGFAGGRANGQGLYAVIDEIPDQHAEVHLLDGEGKRQFTLTFDQSGSPLAVSFTRDGDFMDVLVLNTSGRYLKTLVKRYNLQGSQVAQRVLEGYSDLYSEILHDPEGRIVLASPSRVLRFDFRAPERIEAWDLSQVERVIPWEQGLYLLGSGSLEGKDGLYRLSDTGGVEEVVEFPGQISQSLVLEDRLLLSAGSSLSLFDAEKGEVQELGVVEGEILKIREAAPRELQILTDTGSELLGLP